MKWTKINSKWIDNYSLRLNAGFYLSEGNRNVGNPIVRTLDETLMILRNNNTKLLGELCHSIRMAKRFKRHYVDSYLFGEAFLSGSNITQVFPQVKYLSKTMHEKDLDNLRVQKNWILVTCSGTLGNAALVRDELDGKLLTQHVIRLIPDENKIHPGYLYAYLCTEFAQSQIASFSHGSVIDEINSNQMAQIKVPILEKEIEREIGETIYEAYDSLDHARREIKNIVEKSAKRIEKSSHEV